MRLARFMIAFGFGALVGSYGLGSDAGPIRPNDAGGATDAHGVSAIQESHGKQYCGNEDVLRRAGAVGE